MEEKLLEIENKILREMAYRYGKFLEISKRNNGGKDYVREGQKETD